jgi:4a-hydroxytetrahydrobiopterin dehydratase
MSTADTTDLSAKSCTPCKGGVPPLKGKELLDLKSQVTSWDVIHEHHLMKAFRFPDFKEALDFVNRVASLAEEQNHHPTLELSWGRVVVTLWTHAAVGLTANDFILAAKIDRL